MTVDLHVIIEGVVAIVIALLAWSLKGNWANIRETQQDIRLDIQAVRQDHRGLQDRVTDNGKSIAVLEARIDGLEKRN
jgi:hypothetical protein